MLELVCVWEQIYLSSQLFGKWWVQSLGSEIISEFWKDYSIVFRFTGLLWKSQTPFWLLILCMCSIWLFFLSKFIDRWKSQFLEIHGDMSWCGPIFIHCIGTLVVLFKLDLHVLQFWEIFFNFSLMITSTLFLFYLLDFLILLSVWSSSLSVTFLS